MPGSGRPVDDTAQDSDDFTYEGCNILMAEDNEVNAEIAVSITGEMIYERACRREDPAHHACPMV